MQCHHCWVTDCTVKKKKFTKLGFARHNSHAGPRGVVDADIEPHAAARQLVNDPLGTEAARKGAQGRLRLRFEQVFFFFFFFVVFSIFSIFFVRNRSIRKPFMYVSV
jgi:hypothetical protein